MHLVNHPALFLIPLLPLVGALWGAVFGWKLQRSFGEKAVHLPAVLLPWAACAVALWSFIRLAGAGHDAALYQNLWQWLHIGWLDADLAFSMDRLSGVMCLVVTFVGSLIHVYSIGYMRGDPSYWRFFCYLNLFMFAMLVLVLADNFLLMFVGWEGVGLCSYLLIGFWYQDKEKAVAGNKAFIVNRIGDAGFSLGLFLVFWGLAGVWQGDAPGRAASVTLGERPAAASEAAPDELLGGLSEPQQRMAEEIAAGVAGPSAGSGQASEWTLPAPQAQLMADVAAGLVTHGARPTAHGEAAAPLPRTSVKFREVERILKDPQRRRAFVSQRWLGMSILTLACVLLFVGATGKSAQIPLYVWLPDAMAGPTPVSALIHAATMVTAGVYLVARLHFLFALSPPAMTVVATIGAATALFAATIGLFQYDIKKVLAYSTVSQLGFMFVAVGVGAYWVGIFHLMTHAFFKACLFLGSGSVILGCHHEQDMRRMGGLRKLMPITAVTYFLSCCAIAGFPFFSGFFSKDEILWKVFNTGNMIYGSGGFWLWVIAAAAALCTSFYMFRSYFMTFTGAYRGHGHGDAHADAHADAHDAQGAHHGGEPKESPASMTVVLAILALCAVVGGFVGLPHLWHLPNVFERWLEPVFAGSEHLIRTRGYGVGIEWGLMLLSIVVAFAGFVFARWLYLAGRNPLPGQWLNSPSPYVRGLHRLVYNKYYIDELYGAVFVEGTLGSSRLLRWVDTRIVDGAVNLAGWIGKVCGFLQGWIDKWFVDGLVDLVGGVIIGAGRELRKMQSGRIQGYVYGLVLGSVALVVLTYVVPW